MIGESVSHGKNGLYGKMGWVQSWPCTIYAGATDMFSPIICFSWRVTSLLLTITMVQTLVARISTVTRILLFVKQREIN